MIENGDSIEQIETLLGIPPSELKEYLEEDNNNKAMETNPKDYSEYINDGNAYYNKGAYDQAIDDYSKAIEINPKYFFSYYNRGNAYSEKRSYDLADKDKRKSEELKKEQA